mgnify:CR=1 FL=1
MNMYTVRYTNYDDPEGRDFEEPFKLNADSLAAVCNEVRGQADRICVWAESGLQLIDTRLGDVYEIARKSIKRYVP